MKTIVFISSVLLTTGCMSGDPPGSKAWNMSSPLISVSSKRPTAKAEAGRAAGKFCTGDAPLTERHGYINRSLKDAATGTSASFVKNATFVSNGSGCVSVQGTGLK